MTTSDRSEIHPQAIVDPSAKLAEGVSVGPWSYIGPDVEIAEGTEIMSHVVVKGPTSIGRNNRIFQFSSVGEECQDKKYAGEPTRLVIGDGNLLMAYVHVAHDCIIGDHTILANTATLAGHVTVGDHAILGGGTMVHQFCRIGVHSMSAGGSIVLKDIPAYVMASGQSAKPFGMNVEGLRRRGFSKEVLTALRRAYKIVYRQGLTTSQAVEELEENFADIPEIRPLIDSLCGSDRGIIR